jgi:tetratricopeptide (TPR) repeat protein
MFGFLFSSGTFEEILTNPFFIIIVLFWAWMFVDAIRKQEWVWAVFVGLFFLSAIFYYFLVYRQNRAAGAMPTFELPGAGDRKRIRELEDQIHHLDKAHHHAELGEIYLKQGKLEKACECLEAARERDLEDLDIMGLLAKCFLEQERFEEAKIILEKVVAEDVRHDYGQTQMALGVAYSRLEETPKAIEAWKSVLEGNTYSQARVLLGEAYLSIGKTALAREQFQEVIGDGEHTPEFQRRKEKHWIRRARQLLSKAGEA